MFFITVPFKHTRLLFGMTGPHILLVKGLYVYETNNHLCFKIVLSWFIVPGSFKAYKRQLHTLTSNNIETTDRLCEDLNE